MLTLRTVASIALISSVSGSSASAMSNEENGPSRVAALGFLTFGFLAAPTKGDVFADSDATAADEIGLIGVAGASCGANATV